MAGKVSTAIAGPVPAWADAMSAAATRPAPGGQPWRPGARPWPLFCVLGPVAALPTAPRLARAFMTLVIGEWGIGGASDLADVSQVVISELATNVVQAATGDDDGPACQDGGRLPELWLRLLSDGALLRVEVWDNLPAEAGAPALRHCGTEEEHGRGLELVAMLSRDWGWATIPGLRAKAVWALLEVPGSILRRAARLDCAGSPATSSPREARQTGRQEQ